MIQVSETLFLNLRKKYTWFWDMDLHETAEYFLQLIQPMHDEEELIKRGCQWLNVMGLEETAVIISDCWGWETSKYQCYLGGS